MAQRRADPRDEPFLREMLWLAGQWDRDLAPPLPAEPLPEELERYVEGFGRAGDCGVVAESAGLPVGAAWYRRFPADRPGYGYVSDDIPELSVAVAPRHRGTGLGMGLLEQLLAEAEANGLPGISLSVDPANPARHIYERLGFVKVGEAGSSWTMLRRFGGRHSGREPAAGG